jgi:hypothetical protein
MAIVSVGYPYDLEMDEGQIFVPAMRLVGGKPTYGPEVVLKEPYVFAAYGPVYYSIVGVSLQLVGLSYWPGRLVSVLATVGTCVLIFHGVVKGGGERVSGLAGSALFVVMPAAWSFGSLQRVDALAVLLAMCSVYFVLLHGHSRRWAFAAGTCAALAFLTKQTVIAAACAIVVWYLVRREFALLFSLSAGFGLAVILSMLALVASGNSGYVFNQVVNMQAPFFVRNAIINLRILAQSPGVLVSLVFVALAASRWRGGSVGGVGLTLLYVAAAGVLSASTVGRFGASTNHFGELTAALSLCAGLEMHRWLRSTGAEGRLAATVVCIGLLVTLLVFNVGSYRGRVLIPRAKAGVYEGVVKQLREMVPEGDAVAGEYTDLLLRSRREVFFSGLSMYLGGPDKVQRVLRDALARRELGALVMVGYWDLPGYMRVGSIGYSNPEWVATQHYPGPILYVREELLRLDRERSGS